MSPVLKTHLFLEMPGKGSKESKSAGAGAGKGDDGGEGSSSTAHGKQNISPRLIQKSQNTQKNKSAAAAAASASQASTWTGPYTAPSKILSLNEIKNKIKTLAYDYDLLNSRQHYRRGNARADFYRDLAEFFAKIQQKLSIDISFLNVASTKEEVIEFIARLDALLGQEVSDNIKRATNIRNLKDLILEDKKKGKQRGSHEKTTGRIVYPNGSSLAGNTGFLLIVDASTASKERQGRQEHVWDAARIKRNYISAWEARQKEYQRLRRQYAEAILNFWSETSEGEGKGERKGEEAGNGAAAAKGKGAGAGNGAAAAKGKGAGAGKGGSMTRKNIAGRRRNTRKL